MMQDLETKTLPASGDKCVANLKPSDLLTDGTDYKVDDASNSIEEANSISSAPPEPQEHSDIIFKPGQKCMARETLEGPIYIAKILKVRLPGQDHDQGSQSSKTPSGSRKRPGSQLSKGEPHAKKSAPASFTSPAAAADEDAGSFLVQPTEVFIHFDGWSSKHDR